MSSDSDSDICDFTSSISKQMSKGLNQFWDDFNKIIDEKLDTGDTSYITDTGNLSSNENPTNTAFGESSSTSKQCNKSQDDVLALNEQDVKSLDPNVQNRITKKLNELSAEIQTILQDKRNKSQRGTKRKSPRRCQNRRWQRRNTRKTIKHPVSNLNSSITLSSDDETHTQRNVIEEEINPIVTVNVLWKSVEKNSFKVHKYQTLNCISEHYLEKFQINPKLLFFTLDDKHIKLEENCFVSLRLDDTKQIEGGVLPELYLNNPQQFVTLQDAEPLKFKVQCNDRKKSSIDVSCHENDKMEIIFWKVSRQLEQSVDNIKIYFDGHVIKPSNKICEMDLEDGDCFDLEILNVSANTK